MSGQFIRVHHKVVLFIRYKGTDDLWLFSKSLTCRVDLRSLRSQYGINVDPVKSYFIVWQKVGHVNFIVPIGSKEEIHKDLSKLLQGADDLLSNM